jgi:hypothetical protein
MARNDRNEDTTPADNNDGLPVNAQADGVVATAPAVVEEKTADERFKFVTRPGTSEQVKRKDYILELWTGAVTSNNPEGKKYSRGDIARHLTEITGKKVAYQIVFAATKKVAGGPAPTEAPATGEAPAAEGTTIGG